MIRPQLKDMYMSGADARITGLDGKKVKTATPPPMNASPGELRLWRKLNGLLDENEKKVDALEHNKAKSRQNKYPGTPARQTAAQKAAHRRMSGTATHEDAPVEEMRQEMRQPPAPKGLPRVASMGVKEPRRPSTGGNDRFSGPGSMYGGASPPPSPKGSRAPAARKETPPRGRAESPGRARPAQRRPSPRHASPRALPPKAPSAAKQPAKRPVARPPRDERAYEAEYEAEAEADEESYDADDVGYADDASDAPLPHAAERSAAEEAYLHTAGSTSTSHHSSLASEYAEQMSEQSESKTPSPVATGSQQPSRAQRRVDGAGGRAMAQIEELITTLSLAEKHALQERLAEMIEMHELRELIDR